MNKNIIQLSRELIDGMKENEVLSMHNEFDIGDYVIIYKIYKKDDDDDDDDDED